jgi:hypothetical protein
MGRCGATGSVTVGLIQSVASLMPASWNRIVEWLGLLDGLDVPGETQVVRLLGRPSAFGVLG